MTLLDLPSPDTADAAPVHIQPPAAPSADPAVCGDMPAGAPRFQSPGHVRAMLMALLPQFRIYALALTKNADDTDDLLQELVVRVLAAQAQFLVGTNFKAWCYAILRNQFIDTRRLASRQKSASPSRDADVLSLACDGTQELDLYTLEVVELMARLPVHLREALSCFSAGMSYLEMASDGGVRIGTIRSRVSRARVAVRAAVLDADDSPMLTCESPGCTWNVRARASYARESIRAPV